MLAIALVAANLPWFSERFLFVLSPGGGKRFWMRLLEWGVLYLAVGGIAVGLEQKIYGRVHPQSWEFYVVTVALFAVFAVPGLVYRHILQHLLEHR